VYSSKNSTSYMNDPFERVQINEENSNKFVLLNKVN
jgi:hypothetical protein